MACYCFKNLPTLSKIMEKRENLVQEVFHNFGSHWKRSSDNCRILLSVTFLASFTENPEDRHQLGERDRKMYIQSNKRKLTQSCGPASQPTKKPTKTYICTTKDTNDKSEVKCETSIQNNNSKFLFIPI